MVDQLSSKTLVERMRQAADGICNGPCGEPYWWGEVMLLGATEIERLREELKSREIEHCGHGRPVGHCDTCEEDAERAAQPPKADREVGWLVEAARDDKPQRYRTLEQGMPVWTTDPNAAIRFARRVDAEMFAAEDEDAWHICEHVWVDAPSEDRVAVTKERCLVEPVHGGSFERCDAYPKCPCGGPQDETSAAQPWRCSVCNTMNPDDANHCRQCEFSRTVMRDGKSVPRTGPY